MIACPHPTCITAALTLLIASVAVADRLRTPTCDELAKWSQTVDPADRWEPFTENNRIWLPNAMSKPEFETLFGKPALDWTQADVQSARSAWNGCIQQAKKARDNDLRNLLQDARGYLTTNLRNASRYQERRAQRVTRDPRRQAKQERRPEEQLDAQAARAQQTQGVPSAPISHPGLKAGVDELLAAPPSVEGLIALGSLSNLDIGNADAIQELERQFGYTYGPAGKAAYRVMRELRIRGTTGYETQELPRINARLAEIKPPVLAELKAEFSQSPADLNKRRALAQRYEKLMKQLKVALTEEEYLALADETRKERTSVVDRAVAGAKAQIDQVPGGLQSIAEIDRIVSETAKRGLDTQQRRDLVNHARSRQRTLANEVLNHAAEKELPALPGTLAGIKELNAISSRMLQGVVQKADKEVIEKFVTASDARLAEIGRTALPEYEKALARLPESEAGLAQAEREVSDKEGWIDMEERVRGEYVAIAKARRDAIGVVVDKERAQRNELLDRERKKAIAAGGDPRLVGTEWVDSNNTMKFDFRDHETVFITALGLKVAGTYKVSRDDVVVQGPHGQLVYTFDGDKLTGNGAVFRKTR